MGLTRHHERYVTPLIDCAEVLSGDSVLYWRSDCHSVVS